MHPLRRSTAGVARFLAPHEPALASETSRTALAPISSPEAGAPGRSYKWTALSNTTLGMLMASVNSTSLIIALPVIFRGIGVNPLLASSFDELLWVLMGYMLVAATLVVTLGRIGDMFGRVRMYNLGFAIFTLGAVGAALTWSKGGAGALELIIMRMVQAVGGAMLMANSAAILTDAFPEDERGTALGINQIAGMAGAFVGIIVGGVLSRIGWRWVFLFNVPIGVAGTVWSYWKLRDLGVRTRARIDWIGNLTLAAGLAMLLTGITYGIRPYENHLMGWTDPFVLEMVSGGLLMLVLFVLVERHVSQPLFDLRLFRIRAFSAGNAAGLLSAVGRGGLQFMLIMWLQGIWLPLHGYAFSDTPLWAGIYMLPMTVGFLSAGPLSGHLSDRFGARPFATGGMLLAAASFGMFLALPVDFAFVWFALVLLVNGVAFGMFASPNTAGIMNSLPPSFRGVGSGMRATFQNVGMPLSIGVFFSLMVLRLSATTPAGLYRGLVSHGVSVADASRLSHLPAVGYLFAAFLGYNPLKQLLGPKVLGTLNPRNAQIIVSKRFFPTLIAGAFHDGLTLVLLFALVMCLVAAGASWLRGGRYIYSEDSIDGQLLASQPGRPEAGPGRHPVSKRGSTGIGTSRAGRAPRASVPEDDIDVAVVRPVFDGPADVDEQPEADVLEQKAPVEEVQVLDRDRTDGEGT
jgi:EmrB/QacA subfamily drug resistance transporter